MTARKRTIKSIKQEAIAVAMEAIRRAALNDLDHFIDPDDWRSGDYGRFFAELGALHDELGARYDGDWQESFSWLGASPRRSVRSGNVELRPVPGKDADDVIIF